MEPKADRITPMYFSHGNETPIWKGWKGVVGPTTDKPIRTGGQATLTFVIILVASLKILWRFDWNVNLCGLFGFLQGMAWEDVAHGNLDIKNWRFMRPSRELAEVAQMKKVWKRLELFSWNMLTWKNVTCILEICIIICLDKELRCSF